MSQWDLQTNETRMNFRNYVNDEVVEAVQKKFMEGYDTIYVAFDVMGRTFHEQLSYQLSLRLRALYGPKVNIEVGYNYQCDVKWVTNLGQVAVKELTTGAGCDGCNSNGCNGSGCQFEHEDNPEVEGTDKDFVHCFQDCARCSDNVHVNESGDCHLIVTPEHGSYSIQDIDNAIRNKGLLQSE